MINFDRNTFLTQADAELDSFDAAVRLQKFNAIVDAIEKGEIAVDAPSDWHNMHCHTFYSYNFMQWSPLHVVLAAKILGLKYLGKVEFDVLNGLDEFRTACNRLGIANAVGMETRVYIPEYADREINSPGECGVAYHMGLGFHTEQLTGKAKAFAADLAQRAGNRTRTVVERVNAALKDLQLDFDADVIPLTPSGNPTERHVCSAYRMKAIKQFGDQAMEFWKSALNLSDDKAKKAAASIVELEGSIRSSLMKSGGPGYIKPDATTFPSLVEMNAFVEECGALPCAAWLNGFSAGEKDPEELLSFHKSKGLTALAIIPDRNWNISDPAKKEASIQNLYAVAAAAEKLGLPITAGTELNSPGNKLVDDFSQEPLQKLMAQFLKGAEFACNL